MAEHRFSSEKGCVFVGCCDWGELWLQTLLVCFNLRNEEMVPIRKHSRMQVAGVWLTPTVLGACVSYMDRRTGPCQRWFPAVPPQIRGKTLPWDNVM